ncbi:MarP family serine protease [Actinoplanes sp. NPDC051859]|uniref:MarP family serine protease n=1 Tax=Actinoplanes sp. NPDC051859 TaxID=3363909 RepID=UPI0037A3FA7E
MRAVDAVLILLLVVAAIGGYHQGFLLGTLSMGGFAAGALVGVQAGPLLADRVGSGILRVVVSLVTILVPAAIGQFLASRYGLRLRARVRGDRERRMDAIGGAVVSILAVLVVAALMVVPVRSSVPPWLDRELRSSAILAGTNALLPTPARELSADLARALDADGLPTVFHGLDRISAAEVAAPNPTLADLPIVASARRSVVKIRATAGTAAGCGRGSVGSGFVYAPERVLTNAHVVAGAGEVHVRSGRRDLVATVVAFDPARDVAVLAVPGLDVPVLPFAAEPVRSGADAIVLGFPLDGPYDAQPARIRSVGDVAGPDIYGTGAVDREMYAIRTLVRGGNSGGPLLSPGGTVLGVVFAVADEDAGTGFALTATEIAGVARRGAERSTPVGTGACRRSPS